MRLLGDEYNGESRFYSAVTSLVLRGFCLSPHGAAYYADRAIKLHKRPACGPATLCNLLGVVPSSSDNILKTKMVNAALFIVVIYVLIERSTVA